MLTRPVSATPIEALKTTPRVERLRRTLLETPQTEADEIPRLARRAYEEHPEAPAILKRAHAFAAILDQMTLYVRPEELLVGNRTPMLCAQNRVPSEWFEARNDPRTGNAPMQYEAIDLYPEFLKRISSEAEAAQTELLAGYPAGSAGGFGHIIAGYDRLLREGARSIAHQARKTAERLKPSRQKDCAQAMAIAWEAFARWGNRYAALVESQIGEIDDPVRRMEMEQLRDTLRHVPAEAPANFREALQSVTLMQFALLIEQPNGGSISMGGIDRELYPYLKQDLDTGALTWEQAEELVDSFYVKLMENAIWPRDVVMFANLSIGGRDVDGRDAANDLSLIFLESTARIRSTHPMLSVRRHDNQDPAFYRRACELVRMGLGLPALFDDGRYESVLRQWGLSAKDASRYGIVGCVEPAVMGMVHGQTLGGHVNLLMCLELAMNDGKTLVSGRQLGPHTGRFEHCADMEDLWQAYTAQVEYACALNVESVYAAAEVQRAFYGYPFMSGSMVNAIESGRDITDGVQFNYPTVCMVGVSNVADAMLALEDQVFKKKRLSRKDVMAALQSNYEGAEAVRLRLLNVPKKFGNGSKEAVQVFNRLSAIQKRALRRHPGPRGGHFTSGLWATTWHVRMGAFTGASADGRRAGEPLADGIGAVTGRARSGPTAVALDVAGIQADALWQGGYTFNMKFNQALLAGQEGLDRLTAFTNAFFEAGGMQLQVNTLNEKILRMAQKDPEHYQDLIVRVAGFSAYFCTLSEDVQNEIISRMEHAL